MQPGYIVANHARVLAAALERVAAGKLKRLIVTMPPRHSKSWHISRLFPSWYLGNNKDCPDGKVCVSGACKVRR